MGKGFIRGMVPWGGPVWSTILWGVCGLELLLGCQASDRGDASDRLAAALGFVRS